MKINNPENFDTYVFEEIKENIKTITEMSDSDCKFLNGIIRQTKAKKILELGVAAGGSSLLILNAIKDLPDAKLYSIDYCVQHHKDKTKISGYLVNSFPELKKKWEFFAGARAYKFIEKIGDGIDLCFLDTRHRNPGEFLDYLQILPFMKKNGIIVIHDITRHTHSFSDKAVTCGILFSAICGIKLIPTQAPPNKYFPNIGAVILDDNAMERVFDIFNCLSLPWFEMLPDKELEQLEEYFKKYYSPEMIDWYKRAVEYNKEYTSSRLSLKGKLKSLKRILIDQ